MAQTHEFRIIHSEKQALNICEALLTAAERFI